MVSYRQLASGQVVLKEKDLVISESGHVRGMSLTQEDADFIYYYDQRGGLISKVEKTQLQKFDYWYKNNVRFEGNTKSNYCQRQTPLSEFEKQIGVRFCIPEYRYHHCSCGLNCGCQTHTYTEDEWQKFMQTHTIDYGNLEMIYSMDKPAHVGQGNYDWETYLRKKAEEKDLIVVSMSGLEFREKQKPAVVEKIPETARPNPKEVEKVEPVEPIKEVEKYSPLMIAIAIAE